MPNVSLIVKPVIPLFRHSDWGKTPSFPIYYSVQALSSLYSDVIPTPYVPISHEDRYFSCSGVRVSISTPIEASLSLAISWSIGKGTG